MKTLRKAMGKHDPEVLLGVCLPGDPASGDVKSNDENIDSMLMSHGFEYIDATNPVNTNKTSRVEDEDDGMLLHLTSTSSD